MGHSIFPGVGERIKGRLLALGYERAGKPDAARFIRELRYDGRYFYPWLKDRTPSGENLERLAADLRCSRAWLLLGEGPAPDMPHAAAARPDARAHRRLERRSPPTRRRGTDSFEVLCQARAARVGVAHHQSPLLACPA